MSGKTLMWVAIAACTHAAPAWADLVIFNNGDQVRGKIVSMVDGKLAIDSAVAGRIAVPMSMVSTFTTDAAAQVVMADGTTVQQKIDSAQPGEVAVAPGGTLAPQNLEVGRIHKINPPPEGVWHGRLSLAFDYDRGNSDKDEIDGAARIGRETSHDEYRIWAEYEGDRAKPLGEKRRTTKRDLLFGARYQHILNPRDYWYTQNVAERKGKSDLDLRLRLGGGVGRKWVDTELWRLTGEGGLAWISENFKGEENDDDSYLAGRIAWDALRRINPRLEIFHTAEWFPSLSRIRDHLFELQAGVRTRLTQRLSLETKIDWDYDTTPAEGRERQDVEYLFNFLFDF
jgi:putative salt-induced outer membrane protein YdiY